jgi:hypothetical protein
MFYTIVCTHPLSHQPPSIIGAARQPHQAHQPCKSPGLVKAHTHSVAALTECAATGACKLIRRNINPWLTLSTQLAPGKKMRQQPDKTNDKTLTTRNDTNERSFASGHGFMCHGLHINPKATFAHQRRLVRGSKGRHEGGGTWGVSRVLWLEKAQMGGGCPCRCRNEMRTTLDPTSS